MKLQNVRVEVIEAATAAALQTAVNTFLATPTKREYISVQMQVDNAGPIYVAMVTFTE